MPSERRERFCPKCREMRPWHRSPEGAKGKLCDVCQAATKPRPLARMPRSLKVARGGQERPKGRARLRKARKTPLGALKRKLWTLFARYVKDRDGNKCFTCDAEGLEGRNWHAGHFINAWKASTRYDPENVFSQCSRCNIMLRGNAGEFSARYIERFGTAKFDALVARSRQLHQWTPVQIAELIGAITNSPAWYELFHAQKYGAMK